MGKKLFAILVTILLCVSLTACGQKSPEPTANEEANDATITEQSDVAEEGEGNYRHQIGNCTFYTENDLEQWINGNAFDFYGMMDYFGWTGRREGLSEDEFFVALTPDLISIMEINDFGGPCDYSCIRCTVNNEAFIVVELVGDAGRTLQMPNGLEVPYSLCELVLYMTETIDSESVDVANVLNDMSNDLDGTYTIDARIN